MSSQISANAFFGKPQLALRNEAIDCLQLRFPPNVGLEHNHTRRGKEHEFLDLAQQPKDGDTRCMLTRSTSQPLFRKECKVPVQKRELQETKKSHVRRGKTPRQSRSDISIGSHFSSPANDRNTCTQSSKQPC